MGAGSKARLVASTGVFILLAGSLAVRPGMTAGGSLAQMDGSGPDHRGNLLTMDFKSADLKNVLRLIGEQNGLNIVAGPDVSGSVTVHLKDVSVDEALRNILMANGYHFVRDDNVILVEPKGEAEEQPRESRSMRVFYLNYVDGGDIKSALDGILSKDGKVQTFSRTMVKTGDDNTKVARSDAIIVYDRPEVIDNVEEAIRSLDVPEPQVMIEARIIETLYTKEDQRGIAWPNTFQLLYSKLSLEEKYQSSTGTSGGTTEQIAHAFQWGRLSVKDFQAAIDILSQEQNSKLVSNPRITTLNNQEAEIAVTTSVPIQTVNRFNIANESQDVASYEYIDIGVTLKVTPRVNEGNSITMEVSPSVEEISGYSGPVDSPVPITTKRSTTTQVRVKDGETIIIGGLLKNNRGETISKLWLLGDIPVLGQLFRHRALKEDRTDLTIFITPHIVQD
jgi:type IV pilus secretin PilQ/predicted competence protein